MRIAEARFSLDQGWDKLPDPILWDSEQTMVLVFCAPSFFDTPAPIAELKSKYPRSFILGCSTSGEIQGPHVFDFSIVLSFCRFDKTRFEVMSAPIFKPEESTDVGVQLGDFLRIKQTPTEKLKGALVFSDGLNANGTNLIAGINSSLKEQSVPIGGGLAGDGNAFKRTFIVCDGKIQSNAVVGIGFYGDSIEMRAATGSGWDIFGPERTVTKSRGSVVFEIDGKPALNLYKEYLGDKAAELPASGLFFPLEIAPAGQQEKKLVRTLLAVNEAEKSVTFAGDVPQGWTARLMRGNADRVIDGAWQAFSAVHKLMSESKEPELIVAVSCVGRRLILGERTSEELELINPGLSNPSKVIGFYAYGELSPLEEGGYCDLHNQSMTLFVIRESA